MKGLKKKIRAARRILFKFIKNPFADEEYEEDPSNLNEVIRRTKELRNYYNVSTSEIFARNMRVIDDEDEMMDLYLQEYHELASWGPLIEEIIYYQKELNLDTIKIDSWLDLIVLKPFESLKNQIHGEYNIITKIKEINNEIAKLLENVKDDEICSPPDEVQSSNPTRRLNGLILYLTKIKLRHGCTKSSLSAKAHDVDYDRYVLDEFKIMAHASDKWYGGWKIPKEILDAEEKGYDNLTELEIETLKKRYEAYLTLTFYEEKTYETYPVWRKENIYLHYEYAVIPFKKTKNDAIYQNAQIISFREMKRMIKDAFTTSSDFYEDFPELANIEENVTFELRKKLPRNISVFMDEESNTDIGIHISIDADTGKIMMKGSLLALDVITRKELLPSGDYVFDRFFGYIYEPNPLIATKILEIIDNLDDIKERYKVSTQATERKYGRVGVDIPHVVNPWVDKITKHKIIYFFPSIFNPLIISEIWPLDEDVIYWNRSAMPGQVAEKVIKWLQDNDKSFKRIFPVYMHVLDMTDIMKHVVNFLSNSIYSTAIIGSKELHHAYSLYKKESELNEKILVWNDSSLIDPTKSQTYERIGAIAKQFGYTQEWTPMARQSKEGTCGWHALLRCVMASKMGEKGLYMRYNGGENPEILDYIVLVHRIGSIFTVRSVQELNIYQKIKQ